MFLAAAVALATVAGADLGGSQPANAATKLKWAHVYETSEPYHSTALWAADEIKKRTDGRYEIDVFAASSLGNESAINQSLALGAVDLIYTGVTFAGRSYGPLSISSAPYMMRDYAHFQAYGKSKLFWDLAGGYDKATGNHILSLVYYGQRHVTAKKPILTPDDMKGMKLRVPDSPLYVMYPKTLGANAAPIAFAEVYLALAQGVVDGQENPLPTILAKKFYEPTPHISLTGHITESLVVVASRSLWSGLSDADQNIFSEVMQEAAATCSAQIRQKELDLVTGLAKLGATIHEVDRAPFMKVFESFYATEKLPWTAEQYAALQAIK
ncbi:MAG: DctP family TRAP transporter solute-binding subunit [Azospirillum sp.]|nr:DctP family TRAP transporter solute-binding subunit [Azospirillum sp.]